MNQAQLMSFFKSTLALLGGALATHGIVGSANWEWISGAAVAIAPYVIGYFTNTALAQIQSTAALPQVSTVAIKPTVGNGIAAAAADPTQPKIVKQGT